jgi:hypothetical protein
MSIVLGGLISVVTFSPASTQSKLNSSRISVKLCPASGPEHMTKSERQRRKVEILNSFGANSVEQFNKVKAIEMGHTFRGQAKKWLQQGMTRKRKPVKPATVRGWESYCSSCSE